MMRRGCQVVLFNEPQGPLRDNVDEAQQDAIRMKLGRYDEDGCFYLDAGVDLVWNVIQAQAAA